MDGPALDSGLTDTCSLWAETEFIMILLECSVLLLLLCANTLQILRKGHTHKNSWIGTSLVVQWLRLLPLKERGAGSIPGWGAKTPHASQSKTWNVKLKQCGTNNKRNLIKTLKMKKKASLKNALMNKCTWKCKANSIKMLTKVGSLSNFFF